jgi:hypothetical protein
MECARERWDVYVTQNPPVFIRVTSENECVHFSTKYQLNRILSVCSQFLLLYLINIEPVQGLPIGERPTTELLIGIIVKNTDRHLDDTSTKYLKQISRFVTL